MSKEPLITIIVRICVDQVNFDQVLLHGWLNLLVPISPCDEQGILICSPERSELASETQNIWEHWLYPFTIGSLFFWLCLIFLPFSFLLLMCLSLGSASDIYDHLRFMQAGLQKLLVPDGQTHCLTQLQGASLTLYSAEWCSLMLELQAYGM